MERINLNVPSGVRARLRALARARRLPEAEVARELLIAALGQVERDAAIERLRASYTPEARERHLALVEGMLDLRSPSADARKRSASR